MSTPTCPPRMLRLVNFREYLILSNRQIKVHIQKTRGYASPVSIQWMLCTNPVDSVGGGGFMLPPLRHLLSSDRHARSVNQAFFQEHFQDGRDAPNSLKIFHHILPARLEVSNKRDPIRHLIAPSDTTTFNIIVSLWYCMPSRAI